jgi:hypothetical protein
MPEQPEVEELPLVVRENDKVAMPSRTAAWFRTDGIHEEE